jgi:hypothetical protein
MSESISGLDEFMDDGPAIKATDEVTEGTDLFQSGIKERGDSEFAYKLTSFIPKATTPASGTGYPSEAAFWIIPDLNDVVIVRQVKMFELTFLSKVPPGYNALYLRVDRNNDPNPTDLQSAIWDCVVAKYKGFDGRATAGQTYLLPVLRMNKEFKWEPVIGEMGVLAYNEIKKTVAAADDMSDGRITLKTRPIAVWRSGNKEVTARFDKSFKDGEVERLVKEFESEMPNPREYVRIRAVATENFLKEAWQRYKDGSPVTAATPMNDQERYVEAVMNLSTIQLQGLMKDHEIIVNGSRSKMALVDLALENRDVLEPAVLALAV